MIYKVNTFICLCLNLNTHTHTHTGFIQLTLMWDMWKGAFWIRLVITHAESPIYDQHDLHIVPLSQVCFFLYLLSKSQFIQCSYKYTEANTHIFTHDRKVVTKMDREIKWASQIHASFNVFFFINSKSTPHASYELHIRHRKVVDFNL